MEPYSSSSSSSTSSMYHLATTNNVSQPLQPRKSFHSSLHSVRSSSKQPNHQPSWNTKKKLHIAPLPPPNPPRVYKVDPINFRDLVQRLTSQPGRIQSQRQPPPPPPPPPLQQLLPPKEGEGDHGLVVEREEGSPFSSFFRELMTAETTTAGQSVDMNMVMMRSSYVEELNLLSSPTSSTQHCWFPSQQLLSPTGGNLVSSLDHQRTINL